MKIKKGWFSVACWFLFTFCVLKKQTNKNTSVIELAKKQCSRFHSTLHEAAFWPSRSKIFELLTNTEMRGKMKWSVLVQLSVNVTFWKFELKYHCSWAKRQQLLVFDGKRLKWVSKLFFQAPTASMRCQHVDGDWKSIIITRYNTGLGLPLKWYCDKGRSESVQEHHVWTHKILNGVNWADLISFMWTVGVCTETTAAESGRFFCLPEV